MEMTTFHDPHVVEHASAFLMVKVNVTNPDDPNAAAFIERYDVLGVPTLVVFDAQGRPRPDLSRAGFVSSKELLEIMAQIIPPNHSGGAG